MDSSPRLVCADVECQLYGVCAWTLYELHLTAPLDGEGKKAFADYSIYGQLAFHPTVQTKLYLKGSYDQNLSGSAADYGVIDGTQIACLGGGVENSPIPEVRLHAHANYAFGTNTNPMAVLHDQRTQINVGVTWRMKVL